jgi:hypothetical protein
MWLAKWILILPTLFGVIHANEILVNTQDGQTFVFDVDPDECLGALQDRIASLTEDQAYIVAVPPRNKNWNVTAGTKGGYLGYPRNYSVPVTGAERSDIHYIVTSLADKSLITIAFLKADLEAAGDRIDHIHPLRFLMTVFTEEELKVGIRNIRGRGWVWNQFVGGIKDCLTTESNIGNLKDEYVHHFAKTVEIHPNKILPAIQQRNWDKFIDILIKEIPRKGDHDRYDN